MLEKKKLKAILVYLKSDLRIDKYGKYEQHEPSFSCAYCNIFNTV
jgi:hypothetical protein